MSQQIAYKYIIESLAKVKVNNMSYPPLVRTPSHHRGLPSWSLPLASPPWLFPSTFPSFMSLEIASRRICSISFLRLRQNGRFGLRMKWKSQYFSTLETATPNNPVQFLHKWSGWWHWKYCQVCWWCWTGWWGAHQKGEPLYGETCIAWKSGLAKAAWSSIKTSTRSCTWDKITKDLCSWGAAALKRTWASWWATISAGSWITSTGTLLL